MKQCSLCRTTYTDETLRFCLADGVPLLDIDDDQPTVTRQAGVSAAETIAMPQGRQIRIDTSPQTSPPTYQQSAPSASGSSGGIFKVVLVLIGLGILAVLAIAVGAFIYYNLNRTETVALTNKDVKTPSPSATKDDKDELRDQIANLEKLLNDQRKNNQPSNIPLTLPNQPASITTARVNSPGDGFLALRTLPNSEAGSRILQIPHGATVSVGSCLNTIRIGSKSGRWCRAAYNGYTGWVFDAFLIY